ncbi:predicted protein, partial [Phaeodactylum tricornutum CCAP 1055/1]
SNLNVPYQQQRFTCSKKAPEGNRRSCVVPLPANETRDIVKAHSKPVSLTLPHRNQLVWWQTKKLTHFREKHCCKAYDGLCVVDRSCYGSHGSRTEKEKVGRGLPGPASPAASNVRSADLRVRPQRPGCGALCRVRRRQRSDAGTTRWIRSSPKRQSGVSICSSYSTQWSQRRPNYSRAGPGWSSECHCHSRRIRAWLNLYCRVCTGRRDVSSRQDQRSSSLLRTDSKYQYRRRRDLRLRSETL